MDKAPSEQSYPIADFAVNLIANVPDQALFFQVTHAGIYVARMRAYFPTELKVANDA
jgi:hypothetical protein